MIDLTWLGTAGFIVKSSQGEIAFDPFLSRGEGERSPFTVQSFGNCRAVLVGHGHFDHTFDIPDIVSGTDVSVFAPGLTGRLLRLRGVPSSRLFAAHNTEVLFKPFKVRAFHSAHVRFDLPLIVDTAKRCGLGGCLHVGRLGLSYPKGLVQTYYFEADGKKFLFMSSAGASEIELKTYRDLEVDYFLAPLQGHSRIQEIMAKQTAIINPKVVIPHHHDDFYPPMSQNVSAEVFKDKLNFLGFRGKFLEIPLFKSSQL